MPTHLIHSIVEHLAVARTCVVSKTWMNIWSFFLPPTISENICPIFKFHLYIPSYLNDQVNAPFTKCPLLCFRCILNPPPKFKGFPNLIKVELDVVSITADMTFGSQLSRLELSRCTGIEHLESQFKHTHSLIHSLVLLLNIPHIYTLELCGSTLECLKSLATTMENFKCLVFYDLKLSKFGQSLNALCLIRSSPNLQHLTIHLGHEVAMDSAVESYLGSPDCMNIILDQLQSIEIVDVAGSGAELNLIKLLLASSPALQTITFENFENDYLSPEI